MRRSRDIRVGQDDESLLAMYVTPLLSTPTRRTALAKRWPYSSQA
jgi:hypothetical protein|tara:strand:- start:1641 stop:1775 length:135 start_codon:yes stop_codon:yes gene_type:complete